MYLRQICFIHDLLIDIGNSRTKAALVEDQKVLEVVVITQKEDWIGLVKKNPENILISSVKTNTLEIIQPILEAGLKPVFLSPGLKYQFTWIIVPPKPWAWIGLQLRLEPLRLVKERLYCR
jgi:hypothetical protein